MQILSSPLNATGFLFHFCSFSSLSFYLLTGSLLNVVFAPLVNQKNWDRWTFFPLFPFSSLKFRLKRLRAKIFTFGSFECAFFWDNPSKPRGWASKGHPKEWGCGGGSGVGRGGCPLWVCNRMRAPNEQQLLSLRFVTVLLAPPQPPVPY